VTVLWHRTPRRRSQKDWTTWERISRLVATYLPPAHILHPWPSIRFAVKHPRWEPGARIAPAGICAGGAPGNGRPYRDKPVVPFNVGTLRTAIHGGMLTG
jgi:RNA-directed DNA polymerase